MRHKHQLQQDNQFPSIADRGDRLAALGPPHPGIALLAIALMSFDTREANMKGVASNGSMPQEVVRDFLLELRSGAPNDKDIIIGPPLGVGGRSISCIGRIINLLHFLIQNSSGDLQLPLPFFFFFSSPFWKLIRPDTACVGFITLLEAHSPRHCLCG